MEEDIELRNALCLNLTQNLKQGELVDGALLKRLLRFALLCSRVFKTINKV